MQPELARLVALHVGRRGSGPLFVSRQRRSDGRPHTLTLQRIGQIVGQITRGAGISKHIYPHLLRHTMATRPLAIGMDITDVQKFLAMRTSPARVSMPKPALPCCGACRKTRGRLSVPLRPTCWQDRGALLYGSLAHHLKVAPGTESIVHSPPGKRCVQEPLALFHALEGSLDGLVFLFAQAPGVAALQGA